MAAVRIGKIRLKNGGAEIRVLDRAGPNLDGSNWRGELVKAARRIAERGEPGSDVVGYVVIGIFSDGCSSTSYAYDGDRCPIPRTLLPSWVAEVIRRDMITEVEAEEVAARVVNRSNGFTDE